MIAAWINNAVFFDLITACLVSIKVSPKVYLNRVTFGPILKNKPALSDTASPCLTGDIRVMRVDSRILELHIHFYRFSSTVRSPNTNFNHT